MESFSIWHLLILAIVLLPAILYILSLQKAFQAVDGPLRPMAPGMVWLLLIPLVNIVWIFFVVIRLKTAYSRMGDAGRLASPTDAGYRMGMGMAVCAVLSIIPLIGVLFSLASLVLWILHWIQVGKARQLVLGAAPTGVRSV